MTALTANPAHTFLLDDGKFLATHIPPGCWAVKVHRRGETFAAFAAPRAGNTEPAFDIATGSDRYAVWRAAIDWSNSAETAVMSMDRIVFAGYGDALNETTSTLEGEPVTTLTPAHLEPSINGRGFAALPALNGAYGGEASVYESSAASAPHVWLATSDGSEVRLHLTADQAWRLAEQIVTVVRNHYQGDATPASAVYAVTPLWTETLDD